MTYVSPAMAFNFNCYTTQVIERFILKYSKTTIIDPNWKVCDPTGSYYIIYFFMHITSLYKYALKFGSDHFHCVSRFDLQSDSSQRSVSNYQPTQYNKNIINTNGRKYQGKSHTYFLLYFFVSFY